ncbi:phage tail protein [Leuconostoc suionicum]|uniref:phage tail protein n=1 Tax=Leuconostoc suionicum TaxID=1511761 RepID=UPI003D2AE186
MATQGIVTSYFGLIDDATGQLLKGANGLSDTGIYEADGHQDATAEGATQIQIGNLGTAPTLQYSNNQAKRSTNSRVYPTAEFTMLDLGFEAKQKLLGKIQTASKGYVDGEKDAHVAAIAVTNTLDKQHFIYYAFANGTLFEGNKTLGTNTNNETDSSDLMTLTTMAPIVKDQFKGEAYQVASDLVDGFTLDALMAETFPGYSKTTSGTGDQG